ncbi:undecaprenyl/decaprenyl-phosphate alpha-N-acetylglucosaminyl 1-phosphate transferase [Clostridia bacterium]|nr:undecaprenyl/decaprenyl-phosphate alpha-N-acetylglucosaminyl 1-phosphate transferase [Clostridia bacterium]
MIAEILLLGTIATVISLLLTPIVKRLAIKIGAVDYPNERKVHEGVMPRLGGLAIFLSFLVVSLAFAEKSSTYTGLILADLIIVLTGIADDTKGLGPKLKLMGQVLAALVLVEFGFRINFIVFPITSYIFLERASVIATVLWLVGVTNAINLIDGLDGLAAGTVLFAVFFISVSAYRIGLMPAVLLGAIFGGSILGFLPYNFNPASIFMGDTGSMLLGFNVAALAILGMTKSVTAISLLLPVVILGIPILDTLWAILRRASTGKKIFEADKKHLHHRLLNIGLSHRNTVLTIYAIDVVLGVCAMFIQSLGSWWSLVILVALAALLITMAVRLGIASDEKLDAKQEEEHES